jgi:glycosyltransferase involved in cell wall biosynthesis
VERPALLSVSAIIPVHGRCAHLPKAVESVINQTELPDELIVVVDGAGEDLGFLDGLTAPFVVRVVYQENAGQSAARNLGAAVATSELLAFLDQDDAWHPEHLATLCRSLRESPSVSWSYSDFDEIDAQGQFVTRSFLRKWGILHPKGSLSACLEHDLMVLPSASVLRRAAFEALGGFDETLRGYEDDDLYVRGFRTGWQFAYHPDALTIYRVHAGGDSATRRFSESRRAYSQKLQETIQDDRRMGRYYIRDLVAPRFFDTSLDDYIHAISARDWSKAKNAVRDIRNFGRLRRVRAGLWWKLALLRCPRLFRHLLRAHERLPRTLRLTRNPILHIR